MKKKNSNAKNFDLNADCVNYVNIKQQIILITEDKLKVILMEHRDKINYYNSWHTPLGIFLTCLITTLTVQFRDIFYISADTWNAIFILSSIISGIVLIYCSYKALKYKKNRNIIDLIEIIKNNT